MRAFSLQIQRRFAVKSGRKKVSALFQLKQEQPRFNCVGTSAYL